MLWQQKEQKTDNALPQLVLTGKRITICPPQPDHARLWIDVRRKNKEILKPLEPLWPKDCLEPGFYERRLKRQAREWNTDHAYPFLIFHKDTQKRANPLMGGININHVCRGAAQYASLGYWLDQDCQGQGYMSEAMQLILNFAFETLRLHRMNAAVLPDNQKSMALLERNGFQREGFAEKYIRINGHWRDHILFGLPYERWKDL